MEQRPRPFRLLLASPLIAMGLAAGAAYLLADNSPPKPSAPAPEPVAAEPVPRAMPPAPSPAPATPPPVAAPAPVPAAAAQPAPTVEQEAPPVAYVPDAAGFPPQLADPKVREHATLMVHETMRVALKQGNLENLQRVRATLRDEHIESLLPPADLQAVDLGIACISQAPEARQRALDFLDENPSGPFAEGLRVACQQ